MLRFSLILIILLFSISASAQVRELPCRVEALSSDPLTTDIWDFSQQWRSDDRNNTTIQVYGDSLLAEAIEGRRYWYSIKSDSIFFCGEEDRLTAIRPDTAALIAIKPISCGFSNGNVAFDAHGTGGGKKFPIAEKVTDETMTSLHPGLLILAPGDTVCNVVAVTERRFALVTFPEDSTATETHTMTETVRWYDVDGLRSLLPIALQHSVYYPYTPSSLVPSYTAAYLPERGEYIVKDPSLGENKAEFDYVAIQKALDSATISFDGRRVNASISLYYSGLGIRLDIVDAAGQAFIHQSVVSDGATDEIAVDCSDLRSGEYIAVLSIENTPATPKKELVIIR